MENQKEPVALFAILGAGIALFCQIVDPNFIQAIAIGFIIGAGALIWHRRNI